MGNLFGHARLAAFAAAFALGAVVFADQQTGQQAPPTPPAAGQATPQGQDPQQRPPVFRAGVNAVRVDVIVTDKSGAPVNDLTAADFEVQEDGKPQAIDLFKLVNSDGNVAPGAEPARPIRSNSDLELEAARDDVRLFVIFLDDYHVRRINAMRIREVLSQFIKTQLGPLDMVAVMSPLMSVQQVTFTRDLDAAAASVRAFEGRKYDYRPRNSFEEQYANYPAQVVETVRNEVVMTALRGLSVKLGSLREGRKAIIFVSEGFSSLLPPQMRDPNAQFPGMANPAANNPNAGSSIAEDRARFRSDAELMSDLRMVFDTANRHNTAIYPIDPRGLATGEFDMSENVGGKLDQDLLRATQDTLQVLAINTDGRAIVNRNDLDKGLKQVVRDASAYYLLGYNSSAPADGKFHEIKIRLKRPGVQVRSRRGYTAPTAAEAAKASAPPKPVPPPAVEKALSNVETRQRDAYISTWLGTGRGTDTTTRVTFVWEPIPPIPGEKRQDAARVQVLATGRSGQEYYRGFVPAEGAAPAPDAAAAAAAAPAQPALRSGSKVSFDAPPGRMQVRIIVLNDKGQVLDTFQQDVPLPDFAGTDVRLSTPAVLRARTPREFQAITRDPDPVPTALREFRRTDRLLIRFFANVPGGASSAEVATSLLNRVGQKMVDLTAAAPAEPSQPYQIDLPLAGLSPGEYVIEIRAKGVAGESTELVAIKVIS
ncbi:MAG: VWA domain-containing protein [Vicinamibacterales bacterium]|jgi:VWFA-related protein|nr:VWA domain-containing protein [Vicinamibacterales bacterium]